MENWNIRLFSLVNAGEYPPPALLTAARWTAEWVIFVVVLCMVLGWVYGRRPFRASLMSAGLAASLGLAINQLIGLIWYHPRPFELGIGLQFLPHGLETSFPSDHATVLWALGLWFVGARDTRLWGIVISALGVAVAWSRIYLGIHFPFDMLGSLAVAVFSVLAVNPFKLVIATHVFPLIERLYESVIRILRLPPWLFPQR